MKIVKVKFKNYKYNYNTSVSAKNSDKEIKEYFVGSVFDVGVYPKEILKTCIDIEIY